MPRKMKSLIPVILWVLLFFCAASPAFAQGCAMCKTAAASQSDQATQALNRGILLLLAPPVTIMSVILVFTFRRCNSPRL